jgi:hypothetical protein
MNRFWGWSPGRGSGIHEHYTKRPHGGVSIVEVPSASDQMGPGGGWDWGSPAVQYTGGQVGLFEGSLTKEEKAVLFAGTTLVAGPFAIMRGGVGAISAARVLLLYFLLDSPDSSISSPGGGGPGRSLTSTITPPSVEEVGRMITSGGRSRKSCPPGYRWNGRRCVRKD